MNLNDYIFASMLCTFFTIQEAGTPKETIITIVDSEWDLAQRSIKSDGTVLEIYQPKNGFEKLPPEFYILSWLASTPCCCCSRRAKEYLAEYENQHIDKRDNKRKIFKEYYFYKNPNL